MSNSITQEHYNLIDRRVTIAKQKISEAIHLEFENLLSHLSQCISSPDQAIEISEYELKEYEHKLLLEREIQWANCTDTENKYLQGDEIQPDYG